MNCTKCGSFAINEGYYDRVRGVDSDLCDVHYWMKRATRITELEAQLTDLELKLLTERGAKAWKDVPDATAFVEELRGNSDKPACTFTTCADDSPTPHTLESSCDGAVLWYMGNPGENNPPKFCWHCGGAVVVKEST